MLKHRANIMKAVVTGGAGFIGSHIAEGLLELGYHVIIIDDLSSGKLENIDFILKDPNLEFIKASIASLPALQKLFRNIDFVFHQAAIANVLRSIDDPAAVHTINTTGTLNVLIAARDNMVKKVIFASSSAIYGDTTVQPVHEGIAPNPQSPYALTKLTSEFYCNIFHHLYDLPTACLRYFNVYGPRQDPNSPYAAVIPRFVRWIASEQAPVIYGDGEQTRDFVYVKDVVEANILAAESQVTGIFNIGSGERASVNFLVDLITNLMDRNDVHPVFEKGRPGEVKHSLADISKARNFGYTPKYELKEGLLQTIPSLDHYSPVITPS